MAKKQKHEDHTNHEAWAIPYGDMVTLLLAFFVVMYSISSVNEGKYRVLSDALSQAFGGPPKSIKPVQIGDHRQAGADSDRRINIPLQDNSDNSPPGDDVRTPVMLPGQDQPSSQQQLGASGRTGSKGQQALQRMADAVQKAMGPLIDRNMVVVRKTELRLEIEIRTDILFASGAASIGDKAQEILARNGMRPVDAAVAQKHAAEFPPLHTFSVEKDFGGWAHAQQLHFSDGGIFDQIIARK